jgi:transcription initiation factor TFIIH subunit 1
MSTVCTARASYKKIPGLLELTSTHLQWTQDGRKAPIVCVAHAEVSCASPLTFWEPLFDKFRPHLALFSSKEGAPQVRLKIGLENDSNGHNFTFTSPPPLALTERETFKAQLTTIISNNRAARESGALQSPQTPVPTTVPSPNGAAPHRAPAPTPSRPSTSRAESVSSTRGTPVNDPINDFRIRKKVLVKTPELAALHRELVMSGQITETEFWDGREVLYEPRSLVRDVSCLT